MPASPDPDLALRLAKGTVDVYSQATERLLTIVARRLASGIDQPGWAERKLVEQAQLRDQAVAVVQRLETLGPNAVTEAIELGFGDGAAIGDNDLGIAGQFGRTNTRAVDQLVGETVSMVRSTHGQILRSTMDTYRQVIAEASAPGVVTGTRTRRQAAQEALDRFANQGITGFRDSAGRRWQLESYVEMATRTAAGRAQIAGTLDRYQSQGRDLVIVSDAPQECSLCRPWEGKVLSISGATPGYATVAEAQSAGLQHANCRHSLGAYIPGLTRPMKHTADPQGDRNRQEQRRLERGLRHWKRREAVALDEAARVRARGHVRQWEARLGAHIDRHDLKRLRYREQIGATKGPIVGGRGKTPRPDGDFVSVADKVTRMPSIGTQLGRETRRSLAAIDRVHGLPANLRPVAKVDVLHPKLRPLGQYDGTNRAAPIIEIAGRTEGKASAVAHEFGHYIDHMLLGGGRSWGSVISDDRHLARVIRTARETPTMRALADMDLVEQTSIDHRTYLEQPHEVFARAYAQWVAVRSGDGGMLGELQAFRAQGGTNSMMAWAEDEFVAIADAFDALFAARGLLA